MGWVLSSASRPGLRKCCVGNELGWAGAPACIARDFLSFMPVAALSARSTSFWMSRCRRAVCSAFSANVCRRWSDLRMGLTCELFRPRDCVHALSLLASAIIAARLLKCGLSRGELVGRRPAGTFRLLHCRGPAPSLALHVLGRSRPSLRCLTHG